MESSRLVQHVILRKDLTKAPFSWPAGSMIAQGCHVVLYECTSMHAYPKCLFECCLHSCGKCSRVMVQVSKTLWELKDEANVQAYMGDIDNMHKVTLAAKDEEELRAVVDTLSEHGLHFRR